MRTAAPSATWVLRTLRPSYRARRRVCARGSATLQRPVAGPAVRPARRLCRRGGTVASCRPARPPPLAAVSGRRRLRGTRRPCLRRPGGTAACSQLGRRLGITSPAVVQATVQVPAVAVRLFRWTAARGRRWALCGRRLCPKARPAARAAAAAPGLAPAALRWTFAATLSLLVRERPRPDRACGRGGRAHPRALVVCQA